MRIIIIAATCAAAAAGCLAAPAGAAVQTVAFSTAPVGPVVGTRFESGIGYTVQGAASVTDGGNPGHDLEGDVPVSFFNGVTATSNATVDFKPVANGVTFLGLDYAPISDDDYGLGGYVGTQSLRVEGYLGGMLVGSETFDPGTAQPTNGYWFPFAASGLAGRPIDDLRIFLSATSTNYGEGGSTFTNQGIDNVRFDVPSTAPVPEPATWATMLAGFGAIGAALRRRPRPARPRLA